MRWGGLRRVQCLHDHELPPVRGGGTAAEWGKWGRGGWLEVGEGAAGEEETCWVSGGWRVGEGAAGEEETCWVSGGWRGEKKNRVGKLGWVALFLQAIKNWSRERPGNEARRKIGAHVCE